MQKRRDISSIWFAGAVLLVGVLLAIAQSANAEGFGTRSNWSIDVGRLENRGAGDYGVLVGIKHAAYFSNTPVYLGLEAHTGTDQGGTLSQDNLTYGGLSLGFDGNYFRTVCYDLSLLMGYGFGEVNRYGMSAQSIAFQPTLAVGLIMLDGFRASFTMSYLYMPSSSFSTWLFGVRIGRKVVSTGYGTAE